MPKVPFLLLLLLLLPVRAPLSAQTNQNIRNLQSQQTSLKKEIANQEQMLKSTKKDVNAQLANLTLINAQIEKQQIYVESIHNEIKALNDLIKQEEQKLEELEKELNDCKRRFKQAVAYMYRNRTTISKWLFILSAKDFRQMYRRMRYMTEFTKYQRSQGKIIQQKETQVIAKRAELLASKDEKAKLLIAAEEEAQKLQDQKAERQLMVDQLNKKQKQINKAISQQKKKSAELDAKIDKLIKEEIAAAERRRKAEEEKRKKEEAAKAKKGNTSKSSSGSKTTTFTEAHDPDRELSGNFEANKGKLPMPITGAYAITSHFGAYSVEGLKDVKLDSKGINITGKAGAQARSVFKGEVTSVFSLGGYYNVIVRHGSYLSVYCNLSSISVKRGQQVSERQTLGTVAKDASGNCTLHFQLRKETSKLNPEQWLRK